MKVSPSEVKERQWLTHKLTPPTDVLINCHLQKSCTTFIVIVCNK